MGQKYLPTLIFQEKLQLKKPKERIKVSVLRCNMSTANSLELTRGEEGSERGKLATLRALRCSGVHAALGDSLLFLLGRLCKCEDDDAHKLR